MAILNALLPLKDYFTKDRILAVPPWQREYTWGTGDKAGFDQVYRLLQDLDAFVTSNDSDYLLGVVTLANTNESKNKFEIKYLVDGQQRTVTLLIFLMCCQEYLIRKNKGLAQINKVQLYSDIKNMISFEINNKPFLRVRFSQPEANTILQSIYDWAFSSIEDVSEKNRLLNEHSRNISSKTMLNLLEVRRFLTEELEKEEGGNSLWFGGDIVSGLVKIVYGIKLIELEVSSTEEALSIYDRMNNRGVILNSADLIKNQLFVYSNDEHFEEISNNWNFMNKNLLNHDAARFRDPLFLVKSYAGMKWGKQHREAELAKTFEQYFKLELTDENSISKKALDFSNELLELSKHTLPLSEETSSHHHPLLYAAQKLGAVQHFPLILTGFYIEDLNLRKHFYNQVATRAILQVLSREHPPHVEGLYPKWAHAVYSNLQTLSSDSLDKIYDLHAFNRGIDGEESSKKYKSDRFASLDEQVGMWDYRVSSQKRKIGFTLGLLSWLLDQIAEAESTYKIEHYLDMKCPDPKTNRIIKWDLDHIQASESESSRVSQESKNLIGNLVLLNYKLNRAIKNVPPANKVDDYSIKSSIILTKITDWKNLSQYERKLSNIPTIKAQNIQGWNLSEWGESDIAFRGSFLSKILADLLSLRIQSLLLQDR